MSSDFEKRFAELVKTHRAMFRQPKPDSLDAKVLGLAEDGKYYILKDGNRIIRRSSTTGAIAVDQCVTYRGMSIDAQRAGVAPKPKTQPLILQTANPIQAVLIQYTVTGDLDGYGTRSPYTAPFGGTGYETGYIFIQNKVTVLTPSGISASGTGEPNTADTTQGSIHWYRNNRAIFTSEQPLTAQLNAVWAHVQGFSSEFFLNIYAYAPSPKLIESQVDSRLWLTLDGKGNSTISPPFSSGFKPVYSEYVNPVKELHYKLGPLTGVDFASGFSSTSTGSADQTLGDQIGILSISKTVLTFTPSVPATQL